MDPDEESFTILRVVPKGQRLYWVIMGLMTHLECGQDFVCNVCCAGWIPWGRSYRIRFQWTHSSPEPLSWEFLNLGIDNLRFVNISRRHQLKRNSVCEHTVHESWDHRVNASFQTNFWISADEESESQWLATSHTTEDRTRIQFYTALSTIPVSKHF